VYQLLKIWVRLGLSFYFDHVAFGLKNPDSRPAILACNHPNSFLDAIIIAGLYQKPVHFLVRGDVFAKPWANRLLRQINMIPIYRLSEGRSQLKRNDETFDECIEVLKNNGTLLIFPEGICRHEWAVRPLKKGTARLTLRAWNEGIADLVVRPVTLSYASFTGMPVSVQLREGETIAPVDKEYSVMTHFYQQFNSRLYDQLKQGIYTEAQLQLIKRKPGYGKRALLAVPAFIGWVTHKGFYLLVKRYAGKKTEGSVFFHSVFFGLLLFLYPLVILSMTAMLVLLSGMTILWLLLLILPFTAWCYRNYHSSSFDPVQRQQFDDPVR
jgi:1-acyl-sn-glycerol-3-phosphate acyltransferase